jgi:hypothetical protein
MGKSKDLASGAAYQDQTESDTRYVNTAGDTMTGTLVAGTRLQVGDSSITQGYPQANFGYVADFQAATGSQTFISIAEPSVSSLGDNGTVIGEDTSDTYITQRGNKNIKLGTANVNRLIIDGSGRVTMPSQPRASAGSTMGGAGSNRHPASTIYVQIGGTNLASSGRFTCPVAGVYRATLTGYTNYTGSYGYVYLKKNGSQQGYNIHFNNAQGVMHTIVALNQLVNCTANDYLEFWGGAGSGYVHYSTISFELVG